MDMPFGKHKGTPLEELEDGYLVWLNRADNLYSPLRKAVDAEFARRFGESGAPAAAAPGNYASPTETRGLSAQQVRLLIDVLRTGFNTMIESQDDELLCEELEELREKCKKLTWSAR